MTLQQIEDAYGYARGGLGSLRAKGYFIEPAHVFGRTPLWRAGDVAEWMAAKGRVTKGEQQ